MMVFSYIFFEVLDLDGSNFPLHQYPIDSSAIVTEIETNIVRPYLTRLVEPWIDVSFPWLAKQVDWFQPRFIENLARPQFNTIHHRCYRTALPRSSVTDDL